MTKPPCEAHCLAGGAALFLQEYAKDIHTKNSKIWTICTLISALCMVAVSLFAFFDGECGGMLECTGGLIPMKCHWAYLVTGFIAAAGTVLAIAGLAFSSREGKLGIALGVCVCSILCILVLYVVVGVCANEQMVCNQHRVKIIVAVIFAIAAAVVGAFAPQAGEPKKPKAKL